MKEEKGGRKEGRKAGREGRNNILVINELISIPNLIFTYSNKRDIDEKP